MKPERPGSDPGRKVNDEWVDSSGQSTGLLCAGGRWFVPSSAHLVYACTQCDRQFATSVSLGGHKRHHSPKVKKSIDEVHDDRAKKRILLEERGRRCEVCQNDQWLGQPIPIELDHIDGNPDNKAKENYRLLCPNCHAQTPTYRGRNIGKVRSKRAVVMKKYYGKYR